MTVGDPRRTALKRFRTGPLIRTIAAMMPATRFHRILSALAVVVTGLSGCSEKPIEGPIRVDVIAPSGAFAQPLRAAGTPAPDALLEATGEGLVTFDRTGEVVGGLAARWIVEEDGRSYIFRLAQTRWPDGERLTAREAARLLRTQLSRHPTMLSGLKPEVRGMTEEVLEIRLGAPVPSFLQLLAQPALVVSRPSGGLGGYAATVRRDRVTLLERARPVSRAEGDEAPPPGPPAYLRASRASLAFVRFARGQTDLVLGGTFAHLPLLAASQLPPAVVQADPASGLFGLLVQSDKAFLADRDVREALSMAINRDRIAELLNLSGWQTSTTILPGALELQRPPTVRPWTTRDFALRQSYARSVVNNWTSRRGAIPTLTVALPKGSGARLLHFALAADLRAIGLRLRAVPPSTDADFRLIDEVAPFDSAIWYLHRLSCAMTRPCSEEGQDALDRARTSETQLAMVAALRDAEAATVAEYNYLPIGAPIRFSIVRGSLTGYARSPRVVHPIGMLRQPEGK